MASIEQQPPNKPNFLLVVILFGVAIIAVFIVALIVVRWGPHGKMMPPANKHPTTLVVRPKAAIEA